MTEPAVDRILDVLRTAPEGMTSVQISERLGVPMQTLSSQLSKMRAYGQIDGEFRHGPISANHSGTRRWSVFRLKQQERA